MRTFIPFTEALEIVLSHAVETGTEMVALSDSLGRTLAGGLRADTDIPPFASSAMDGFAVRTADFADDDHRSVRVIGHVAAGTVELPFVEEGTCVEIMTGAPFPPGADAVIPVEWVRSRSGDAVVFERTPGSGKHVRPAAEDIRKGDQVFRGGELISPSVLGMMATLGVDPVTVRRAPRVRVISTGDEIVPPASTPGPGQIRNSNGPALRAQVLDAGGACDQYEHAPDDPAAIRTCIESGPESDLIVFSGGVSVGDHDHVKAVLDGLGAETLFWKVRQRPGKPLVFGTLGDSLFLGLPGNPVSSAMCFEIYVRSLLERMLGRSAPRSPLLPARLSREMGKVEGLHFFARGRATVSAEGEIVVEDAGPQRSNLYGSVVRANCIVHLPADKDHMPAGASVFIQMLPWAALGGISS